MIPTTGTRAPDPSAVTFRSAVTADLPALVRMLADDALGRQREDPGEPLNPSYLEAFHAIQEDPNNEILVACLGEEVVGMLQLTFTPSISFQGSWRATVESVRIRVDLRGRGVGGRLMEFAVERAVARGCGMMQLTTNKARPDARRFYERLGFTASHEGMKRPLGASPPSPDPG
jgi:ribosomal protein S18 acetylase RimI-like enzyme